MIFLPFGVEAFLKTLKLVQAKPKDFPCMLNYQSVQLINSTIKVGSCHMQS